ncbi:MAG: ABC transporter permease [Saprospiraceae bacterium]|nr:ABC transporter permease [Saprospiraceae bacterium]
MIQFTKLSLIIRREYLSRVTRKSFILATLLTPLAFALLFVIVCLIFQYQGDKSMKIAILDEGNMLNGAFKDDQNLYFKFETGSLEELIDQLPETDYNALVYLPTIEDLYSKRLTAYYYSDDQPSPDLEIKLRERIGQAVRDYKIDALQLERRQLEALETRIEVEPEPLTDKGEDATRFTSAVAASLGMGMGFIMYLTVFIYGVMVMRSVMEEKTNRIVEVMISSVRPFELMLGKIIGVGGVGLTQVAIWAILIPLIGGLAQLIFGIDANSPMLDTQASTFNPDDTQAMISLALTEIASINWWTVLPLFILYFLGGFFIYSALFAAVGSAMGDDTGEGQSLTIPITIPVILALYIMIAVIQSPNSNLAIWSSIFPLFSPIVMPARLAFGPPTWEIIVSLLVMLATAVFLVWLSGRIYRVGILMYGKKVKLKDIGKWLFFKD